MNKKSKKEELEQKLKTSIFIVGGGAWQHLWEEESKNCIGFDSNKEQETRLPSPNQLKSSIKPELIKRFRDEIVFLSPMTREDYIEVAISIHSKLPTYLKQPFCNKVEQDIHEAITEDLGMRFFERIITSSLIETKQIGKHHENI